MRVFVLPYKRGSISARDLANAIGCRRLRLTNSRYRYREGDRIINWGRSQLPDNVPQRAVINSPSAVRKASSKLAALITMKGADVPVPPFTTCYEQAKTWVEQGTTVVERHLLRANSGRGIEVVTAADDVSPAPLYTKYIKKKEEYRVHVIHGEVVDTQRKMRCRDVPDEDVNWQVRNHSNGFIFGREDVSDHPVRDLIAKQAVASLGLDFGAVDVIYNERSDKYYVLEVNTAPGLVGTTLEIYTQLGE